MAEFGPIEIMVVDFDGYHFKGELMPELERLKEADIVRMVDLLVVRKDRSGALAILTATDLGMQEMLDFGAKIGSLIGSGIALDNSAIEGALAGLSMVSTGHVFDEAEARRLASDLPNGFAAAVVILEHRWAIPLHAAIGRAAGKIVSAEWLTAERLSMLGRGADYLEPPSGNGHGSEY